MNPLLLVPNAVFSLAFLPMCCFPVQFSYAGKWGEAVLNDFHLEMNTDKKSDLEIQGRAIFSKKTRTELQITLFRLW